MECEAIDHFVVGTYALRAVLRGTEGGGWHLAKQSRLGQKSGRGWGPDGLTVGQLGDRYRCGLAQLKL